VVLEVLGPLVVRELGLRLVQQHRMVRLVRHHMGQVLEQHSRMGLVVGVVGHILVEVEVGVVGVMHKHMVVVVEVRKSTSCLTYGLRI